MDNISSNEIKPYRFVLERKAEARNYNQQIADFWDKPVIPAQMKQVVDEKIKPLSEHTQSYLFGLLVAGRHIGLSLENLRAEFMRDPVILEYWSQNQDKVDLYELFEKVDKECLAVGLVSEGYTTMWTVDNETGEIFNRNDLQHRPEEGRRFTLPVDYQTVKYLLAPDQEPIGPDI